jgi:hypothetical protein
VRHLKLDVVEEERYVVQTVSGEAPSRASKAGPTLRDAQ